LNQKNGLQKNKPVLANRSSYFMHWWLKELNFF
jgi:hypothetical protein